MFARASGFDASRAALPWLLAIAANECRTMRQRRARRREDPLVDREPAAPDCPEALVLAADERAAIESVTGTLDALDAETLRQAMDQRPPGATFRKRLERAIGRFRDRWRAHHG
ncbi:MAG: hypothetical protein ACOZNI_22100 [Myxococcota bacterium]